MELQTTAKIILKYFIIRLFILLTNKLALSIISFTTI